MGSIISAWLVGEGIIIYRTVKKDHAPPLPGNLLVTSGVFVLLGLLAESEKARFLAQALAWGFDIAAFMNLGNLFGTGTVKELGNVVPWPPPIAPNTQLFPSGKQGSSSSAPSQGPASNKQGPSSGTGAIPA